MGDLMGLAEKIKQNYSMEPYKGVKKAVLAYSGGLDTSILVKLIPQLMGAQVITVTVDLGGSEYTDPAQDAAVKRRAVDKAVQLGAIKTYLIDGKKEFATDYIFPAIKANSLYSDHNVNSTAMARYLISKKLVEVAEKEGADAIVHGSTGKGNDQVRFDISIQALSDFKVFAPIRDWNLMRQEEAEYARQEGIQLETKAKPYSVDANMWGKFTGGEQLEDPANDLDYSVFNWVTPPSKAKDSATVLTIHWERGVPVKIEHEGKQETDPVKMIELANRLGAENGVGIINYVEDKTIGLKSREVYECPGAKILLIAHKDLERYILTKEENELKPSIEKAWSSAAFNGLWFAPVMKALNAFIDATQERVSGWTKVQLYKGNADVLARHSENSIFNVDLVSYDTTTYDQREAVGFIKNWGNNTVFANRLARKKHGKGK